MPRKEPDDPLAAALLDLHRMTLLALKLQVMYDDCNPDVGFGPFIETQLDTVIVNAGVNPDRINKEAVLRLAHQRGIKGR